MKYIVAIDQSTSATKAVLFDAAGEVVDRVSREHLQIFPQAGWVEHDAEEIWQNVLSVLNELASRKPDEIATASALAIANQRETFVVFDRKTGRPVHNAIVWQCRRGEPVCRQLRDEGHEAVVRSKTGLKLDTYFSGSKLKWLIDSQPQIGQLIAHGEALIGTIETYLIYRLTKATVFATDHTNASRTLLYDIARMRWDEQLCCLFGVPMRGLAEIRESFAGFGSTDADGAFPKEIPICGVMGDSQASLFAQGCFEPGNCKATYGSGTSILLNTGEAIPACDDAAVSALAWVWQGRPTYASEGIINYSSATISWLKDQLGLISDAAETNELAKSVTGTDGVYLVPAFVGLGAPYWQPAARAAIVGMTPNSRKEHIVRAALESIAYQIRDALNAMPTKRETTEAALFADGGPTRNEFLMQFTADILRREIIVANVAESSARGAAMAAMLGSGIVRSFAELPVASRSARRYSPKMEAGEAERLYSGWKCAVRRVL